MTEEPINIKYWKVWTSYITIILIFFGYTFWQVQKINAQPYDGGSWLPVGRAFDEISGFFIIVVFFSVAYTLLDFIGQLGNDNRRALASLFGFPLVGLVVLFLTLGVLFGL